MDRKKFESIADPEPDEEIEEKKSTGKKGDPIPIKDPLEATDNKSYIIVKE